MYFEVNSWMLSLLVRSTSGSDDDDDDNGLSAMWLASYSSYNIIYFLIFGLTYIDSHRAHTHDHVVGT